MDYDHCDDYEQFLQELAFGDKPQETLHQLYIKAFNDVQPTPLNLSEEEELQEAMDDCWDSEWINPLTGLPHYVAANLILTGTSFEPDKVALNHLFQKYKLCTFCANKYGKHSHRCTTHTVSQCRLLANTTCLHCKQKGHTVSHCPIKHIKSSSSINTTTKITKSRPTTISILDKAGGFNNLS